MLSAEFFSDLSISHWWCLFCYVVGLELGNRASEGYLSICHGIQVVLELFCLERGRGCWCCGEDGFIGFFVEDKDGVVEWNSLEYVCVGGEKFMGSECGCREWCMYVCMYVCM